MASTRFTKQMREDVRNAIVADTTAAKRAELERVEAALFEALVAASIPPDFASSSVVLEHPTWFALADTVTFREHSGDMYIPRLRDNSPHRPGSTSMHSMAPRRIPASLSGYYSDRMVVQLSGAQAEVMHAHIAAKHAFNRLVVDTSSSLDAMLESFSTVERFATDVPELKAYAPDTAPRQRSTRTALVVSTAPVLAALYAAGLPSPTPEVQGV